MQRRLPTQTGIIEFEMQGGHRELSREKLYQTCYARDAHGQRALAVVDRRARRGAKSVSNRLAGRCVIGRGRLPPSLVLNEKRSPTMIATRSWPNDWRMPANFLRCEAGLRSMVLKPKALRLWYRQGILYRALVSGPYSSTQLLLQCWICVGLSEKYRDT